MLSKLRKKEPSLYLPTVQQRIHKRPRQSPQTHSSNRPKSTEKTAALPNILLRSFQKEPSQAKTPPRVFSPQSTVKRIRPRVKENLLSLKEIPSHCVCGPQTRESWLRSASIPLHKLISVLPEVRLLKQRDRKDVQYPSKLIVFNIENLLISQTSKQEWIIRPKLIRMLSKLQFFFHIAFIYEFGYPGTLRFLKLLKQNKIKPSALYEVNRKSVDLLDYSEICKDFGDVLVVSALNIETEDADFLHGSDLIAVRRGTMFKMMVKRPPVNFLHCPPTLCVPCLAKDTPAISAFSLARVILIHKDELFSRISLNSQLEVVQSSIPNDILLDHAISPKDLVIMQCSLHGQCVANTEQSVSVFAVMKLAQFMNKHVPNLL